jgi:hypothetical protein
MEFRNHWWCEEETEEDLILDVVDIIPQTYWETNLSEKLWIQFLTPMILTYSIFYILCVIMYWVIFLYIKLYITYV